MPYVYNVHCITGLQELSELAKDRCTWTCGVSVLTVWSKMRRYSPIRKETKGESKKYKELNLSSSFHLLGKLIATYSHGIIYLNWFYIYYLFEYYKWRMYYWLIRCLCPLDLLGRLTGPSSLTPWTPDIMLEPMSAVLRQIVVLIVGVESGGRRWWWHSIGPTLQPAGARYKNLSTTGHEARWRTFC